MADIKKRYDEQPALSPELMASDISCVSRSPFGSGAPFQKYTQAQLAEFMQNYLTFSTELAIVNVSKAGNDSTADGSLQFPFLTIRAAQLSILDASASKVYTIVPQPGTYMETGLTFMPFQYICALVPETVVISLTNDMGWDPTWLLQSPVGGLINLNFAGAGRVRVINSVGAGYAHNGVLNFLNCDIPFFNLNFGRDIVTTINNCKISYYETNRSDVSVINCRIVDSFIQSGITRVNNCSFTGTGLINSVLGSDDIYIYNSQIDGAFTISGSGTNLYCDAPSYPSNLTIASSATVNRLTTSETILTDYTPVNFTATDSSVRGAIEGIDAELSGVGPITQGTELLTWSGITGLPYTSNVYWTKRADIIFLRFEASAVVATTSGVMTSSALPGGLRPFMATNFIEGNLIALDNGTTVLAKINIYSSGVVTISGSIDGASFSGLSGIGNTGYNSFVFSYTR
ncbi:MAG: hypothetical protein COY58_00960 [Gammaproteobacteria bacterium CG_4_10_14_0_8_um_filter_38_16]|nr:MAG: hypothetical protein COY58_00960 [Gammaproteobacteria bacterium CG_4_10_14_0_8_um_filter_38_16]